MSTSSRGDTPLKTETQDETERNARLIVDFRRFLEVAGIRSGETYARSVESFFGRCAEEGIDALAARPCDFDSWRSMLLSRCHSRASVNNAMNRLKRFYRWAYRKRLVPADPFAGYKGLSTGRSLPKTILSVEDMGKLLAGFSLLHDRDLMLKSVVEILYGSALRISEAETLRVEEVDFESGVILIHERKTMLDRKTPVSDAALAAVRRYMDRARAACTTAADRAQGFLYPQRGPTTLRCLLNSKLARECERLGLKRITTHSFRHSAATHLLKSGAGIRQVQAFLGHKSISSTERYTHVVTEDLKAVLGSFHPREIAP